MTPFYDGKIEARLIAELEKERDPDVIFDICALLLRKGAPKVVDIVIDVDCLLWNPRNVEGPETEQQLLVLVGRESDGVVELSEVWRGFVPGRRCCPATGRPDGLRCDNAGQVSLNGRNPRQVVNRQVDELASEERDVVRNHRALGLGLLAQDRRLRAPAR